MPEMMDIYKQNSFEYDELVDREDWEHNFHDYILKKFPWDGARVMEAGIGTGRMAKIYLEKAALLYGFDREKHMLDRAAMNLETWKEKAILTRGVNESLPLLPDKADIFIEGWSFGHTMIENSDAMKRVFTGMLETIKENLTSGGKIIIIETMGTNVTEPGPPITELGEFYDLLENHFGFTLKTLRTEYRFDSVEEAERICGFFFGKEMGEAIARAGSEIVPEFTGVFYREV